jgi:hypothetical protein
MSAPLGGVAPVTTIDVCSFDVVVGRGSAPTTRQPLAGRRRGELENQGRYPHHEPLVAVITAPRL